MISALVLVVAGPLMAEAAPAELQRWSFSSSPAAAKLSPDVPGRFIYDPLTQRSTVNETSADFATGDQADVTAFVTDWSIGTALEPGESVTLEGFVQPAPTARGRQWLFGQSRHSQAGSELAAVWVWIGNSQQTWHGAQYALPQQPPERFAAGHYSSTTRLTGDSPRWRHLAVVYEASAKRVSCWVDYHLLRTQTLEQPLVWDDAPVVIGAPKGRLLAKLDEIRVVRGVLGPAEFLRARDDAISGVSFRSTQAIAPRDSGCLDVKEHFGAAGDGRTDDTAAFNLAFDQLTSRVPLAYHTLLIPPGEYVVSGMLRCSRFIDVKGAGPERTVIRLKDDTFTDPTQPQPVLRMSSSAGAPGTYRGVNGSSISIYLDGVTIDAGRNPGAKGLEYHSNNLGRLENVVIRSGADTGLVGLDLTHHDVGPALVKRVRIEGFDTGVAIRYQEYSMTFEQLTLRNQRRVGIHNQGNILALRRVESHNRVPAIISEGANSMVTLLDSRLVGGAPTHSAVRAEGGLYCLRVDTAGYAAAIDKRELVQQKPPEWRDSTIPGPRVDEYVGDQAVVDAGSERGALKLPIAETPEPVLPPLAEWTSVVRYAAYKVGDDWGPAVQAAIDDGARVLYLPSTERYTFRTPVRLHGAIERVLAFGHELSWHPEVWRAKNPLEQTDAASAAPPLLIFDEPRRERVILLDRVGCVHVQHASPGTLVLRSSTPRRYSTSAAEGRLFAEDIGGADWHFDHPQQVWVRQWNPESHAAGPCIHNRGATIWSLGFKTEYESQKLLAEAGARTELLGAFIYPIGKIPPERPIFENRDSQLALIYGVSVYAANHRIHVRDVQRGVTQEYGNDALRWAGSRGRMDLFVSRPEP